MEQAGNHVTGESPKKAAFDKLTVLTIDDNPTILNLLSQVLRSLGVSRVLQASNGQTGLNFLDKQAVDIVICDLLMEPMDGLEFTRTVRRAATYRHPWVPILVLSGYSDLPHILEARDAGATDFLTKPFAPKTLFQRIVDVIERPRLFVQVDSYYGPCRRRKKVAYEGPERRRKDAPEVVDVHPDDHLRGNDAAAAKRASAAKETDAAPGNDGAAPRPARGADAQDEVVEKSEAVG